MKQTKKSMIATGHNFVVNMAMTEMRTRWAHDLELRNALKELENHVGEIYMNDLKLERLT